MSKNVIKTVIGAFAIAGAISLLPACSQEISHTEETKKGWFGETKHTEETIKRNPDGTISRERQEIKVNP
jgi:hypothetical protein